MTQWEKSQSIGVLMIVVFSAMPLWVLTAVVWPVPVVHADDPEILTITVTSNLETYFYDPGLDPTGGTVYFNSVGGEGAGQVLTVTVTCSGTSDDSTFEGAPAFGDTPPLDTSAPWQVTYTVEAGAGTQSGIVFTVTNTITETDTAVITFTEDITGPSITSPYISESSDYLHFDGLLTIYYGNDMESAQTFTVTGHSSDDSGAGLGSVDFSPALGDDPYNQGTLNDWWGEYSAASGNTKSGQITVTVYDLLNNSTTQVFTYTRDTGNPTSVAGSPQYDNEAPIVVTYTNATDTGGSGLKSVRLWYKKEISGTWADSGLPAETSSSGSFNFTPTEGDGTYYFASVATDNVGNEEAPPTGPGDDETLYDTMAPSVPGNFAYQPDGDSGGDGFLPEVGYYDDTVINLKWDPSTDDDGSGLLTPPYHLGTAPQPTGALYPEDSPYDVGSSGTYSIYLTAEDNAGNISEDAVTGPVIVDLEDPQPDVYCPDSTGERSFVVDWSATTDQGHAGLRSTDPYSVSYKVAGGNWEDWITATSAVTATFGPTSPITVEHNYTYCFRVRAVDKAGNVAYTNGDDCTKTYPPDIQKVFLPIIIQGYCSCGPDNYEPNDSCDQAHGPLTSGPTYQSWISCCDQATSKNDYFYIDINTTNAINIYLTDIPAGTDYDLYLYKDPCGSPGNPVDKSNRYGSISERISYNPFATGRYYIRVCGFRGSSTSPYSLQVIYN